MSSRASVWREAEQTQAVRAERQGRAESRTRRDRGPTGAFELAAVAESGDQFEYRVECGFEWFGVAFDLGE